MLLEFLYWFDVTFGDKSILEQIWILTTDYYLWIFWLILFYLFIKEMVLPSYLQWRQNLFLGKQPKIILAIDVPKKNEQSIIGMDLALTQMLGAHTTFNWSEKWIDGRVQESMTLEIVSIDGYIQLLIRCPRKWRDLIESSIYGQYPDAEITEVEDYVNGVPDKYPNDTHDMWGVEWSMDKNPCYPIKTYQEFEDKMNQLYVDPLAGLLEAMARIGKGEQIWLHFRCKPLAVNWAVESKCEVELNALLGREQAKPKQGIIAKILDIPFRVVNDVTEHGLGVSLFPKSTSEEKKEESYIMWKKTSNELDRIKLLEKKTEKMAYGVKMRYGYFSEKEVMNKTRGVNSVIGAIKQFNAMGRNGFRPELRKTAPRAYYLFVDRRIAFRKTRATFALKKRDGDIGIPAFPLNTEELATIFHFPSMLIKAPMLKHTEVIKGVAPTNLPFGEIEAMTPTESFGAEVPHLPSAVAENTPVAVEEPSYNFDYDNDEFERRFAINPEVVKLREKIKQEAVAKADAARKIEEIEEKAKPSDEHGLPARLPAIKPAPHAETESPSVEVMDFFVGPGAKLPQDKVKRYDADKDIPDNLPFI